MPERQPKVFGRKASRIDPAGDHFPNRQVRKHEPPEIQPDGFRLGRCGARHGIAECRVKIGRRGVHWIAFRINDGVGHAGRIERAPRRLGHGNLAGHRANAGLVAMLRGVALSSLCAATEFVEVDGLRADLARYRGHASREVVLPLRNVGANKQSGASAGPPDTLAVFPDELPFRSELAAHGRVLVNQIPLEIQTGGYTLPGCLVDIAAQIVRSTQFDGVVAHAAVPVGKGPAGDVNQIDTAEGLGILDQLAEGINFVRLIEQQVGSADGIIAAGIGRRWQPFTAHTRAAIPGMHPVPIRLKALMPVAAVKNDGRVGSAEVSPGARRTVYSTSAWTVAPFLLRRKVFSWPVVSCTTVHTPRLAAGAKTSTNCNRKSGP